MHSHMLFDAFNQTIHYFFHDLNRLLYHLIPTFFVCQCTKAYTLLWHEILQVMRSRTVPTPYPLRSSPSQITSQSWLSLSTMLRFFFLNKQFPFCIANLGKHPPNVTRLPWQTHRIQVHCIIQVAHWSVFFFQ